MPAAHSSPQVFETPLCAPVDYPSPVPHHFKAARTLGRNEIWSGPVGTFGVDEVELDGGLRIELALLKHPGASAIVPFLSQDRILLLRQYRYAASQTLWEVPAGKLDPGEAPATCASRELEEETGYRAGRLEHMGSIFTTPGFTDEVIHLFAAHDLRPGTLGQSDDERIEVVEITLADALEKVCAGEVSDAKTICALFHAQRFARANAPMP